MKTVDEECVNDVDERFLSNPMINQTEEDNNNNGQQLLPTSKRNLFSVVKELFDVENVKDTMSTVLKQRPNKGRQQIFLLYLVIFIVVIVQFGLEGIFLQFCQKVYHMTPSTFSNLSSISKLVSTFLTIFSTLVLIKCFKLNEGLLLVLSLPSGILAYLVIGTFLTPVWYFISLPIGL